MVGVQDNVKFSPGATFDGFTTRSVTAAGVGQPVTVRVTLLLAAASAGLQVGVARTWTCCIPEPPAVRL